jgi:hypothetical protein
VPWSTTPAELVAITSRPTCVEGTASLGSTLRPLPMD